MLRKIRTNVKDVERENSWKQGLLMKIRVFGRRKLENVWGDYEWIGNERVNGTPVYEINQGDYKKVVNMINLKLVLYRIENRD